MKYCLDHFLYSVNMSEPDNDSCLPHANPSLPTLLIAPSTQLQCSMLGAEQCRDPTSIAVITFPDIGLKRRSCIGATQIQSLMHTEPLKLHGCLFLPLQENPSRRCEC